MVKENTLIVKKIVIMRVNGIMIKCSILDFCRLEITFFKEPSNLILNKALELRLFKMEINIQEIIFKTSSMVKANMFGQRDLSIWDTLNMAIDKDLESGFLKNNKVKPMQDSIQMIKSMELVSIFGRMDVFIKVISKWIKSTFYDYLEKEWDVCSILMGEQYRVYGKIIN